MKLYTQKLYTNLKQSKKLAEFLPLETADMFWYRDAVTTEVSPRIMNYRQVPKLQSMYYFPCWSLTALFSYLRGIDFFPQIDVDEFKVTMSITYFNDHEARHLTPVRNITVEEAKSKAMKALSELEISKLLGIEK